ncbi:hypothetical protein AB1Y20_016239 [Prymnesium parvum]|uniref:Carbohydrate-binding/sugar hydrolysis domain-containing protein n=1 Tax=Prymnesium parvum TaxID=97485 RepID=A0AB34IC52_PRYPA
MCQLTVSAEVADVEAGSGRAVLFMASITAPLATALSQPAAPRPPAASPRGTPPPLAPPPTLVELDPSSLQSLDVCCLEGCGLGWRVRPPLRRRSPWTVVAQRMRLSIESVGNCKIEKLYTLLDHHELSPRFSYEVAIGDLHAGDVCHVPVLVWLPKLQEPTATMETVKFSLSYVDAVKIDTRSCEACASISRPAVESPRAADPPIQLLRERNRVLVSEAMHHAVAAANNHQLDTACSLMAEAEAMISLSPSTLKRDPLSVRLLESLTDGLRRLENALGEHKCRSSPSSILEKLPLHQQTPLQQQQATTRSDAGLLMGPAVSATSPDARTPLKPRTFSVTLPFSLGAARAEMPSAIIPTSPLTLQHLSTAGFSGSASLGVSRAMLARETADSASTLPHAAADADGAPPPAAIEPLRHSAALPPKAPPPRLLSSVSFVSAKQTGRMRGALRGRPRLQPPVLLPLHAPPTAARDATLGTVAPPLGIVPPLPPPGVPSRSHGSFEAWLCRLLRCPLRPLPLPDELIMHIFSFLQPSILFHDTLALSSLIVDKSSSIRGNFTTISAALRAAHPGDRIVIRPGVYRESLKIDMPVMLLGCPSASGGAIGSGVTITSSRNHTVHSTTLFARMANVTLRQTGSSGRSCLLVSRGRIEVSECDISSTSGLCVEVTDAAAPIVRHSRIHGGAAAGLWFRAAGCGLVEGNEIWGNGWSGVQISDESNPTLLRNYIHDNKSAGIISFNHGRGIARHNDITSNGKGGVQVRSRACPELEHNRIFAERSFGVWVYEHGLGKFEDNDIVNNAWSGFQVEEGSAPVVVGNRLRGNRSAGIVVYNRGSGMYEWNDISCNGRCGVQIKSGSAPTFRHNRIHHEKQAGVLTAEDGTGVLEDNDIFDNQWSGVQTEGPSNPLLRRNHIHHNGGAGFIAYQNGSGLLEANNIYGNKKYGVQSKTGGHPTVRQNRIHDKVYGIYLTESGGGVYEENRIHNIRGSGIFVSADCSPVLTNNHGTS